MVKKVLGVLEKCYSIAPLTYRNAPHFLVASEKQYSCLLFNSDGVQVDTVWETPGGVMSMVQVPNTDGQFIATHSFYSPNDSKKARLVIATPGDSGWSIRTLVDLPFVHRFDIVKSEGKNYIIACTLKSGHEYKDDWSTPGKVYAAELPDDLKGFNDENQLGLTVIKDNMLKNHGYYRVMENDRESSLVCSENGVFRIYPPTENNAQWVINQLLDTPASDAVLADLDGDGRNELVVMSPFHGDTLQFFSETDSGYVLSYEYPRKLPFLHAIWCGEIKGKQAVVVGNRQGNRELLMLTWDSSEGKYQYEVIDEGRGAANAYGFFIDDRQFLIAANRETDEIAMYSF